MSNETMSSADIKPIINKWKGDLTDRQRFNQQMHYGDFDRCFNMEFGYWRENFNAWSLFYENNITSNEQADIFFNFDTIKKIDPLWINPSYQEVVVEQTQTYKRIINPEGLLVEVPLDGHETIPHIIRSSVITPDDWKTCKEKHFRRDDSDRKINVDELKKLYPDSRDYPLGVDCGSMIGKVRDLLTFEGLAYATYDYPQMVEDMVETFCLLVEDFLDRVLGVINFDYASGWEDICFKSGPIVSIDFFENVVVPRYKRISKKLHAHGVDLWYTDCDGDVRPIIPLLLEGGINCLFPLEVNCSGHPADILNEYGKELRIMGGVDKMQLANGTEAIKAYLESLTPLVERGGYIPFCDHRCPPNVKPEDYLYYLDLKEQMFGLK